MNVKDIIPSGLLEAYVLGQTTDAEAAHIHALCKQHPEVLREVEAIEAALLQYGAAQFGPPSAGLEETIASRLFSNTGPAKVVPLKDRRVRLYRIGLAASLLLFVSSLVYNARLQSKIEDLHLQVAALSSSQTYMAQEFEIQKVAYQRMASELAIAMDPSMKKVVLSGMNYLANHQAVVHWNSSTHEVYFNAASMEAPQGKQFQLWAIVDGKPVDVGTIDATGTAVFQKMKTIALAQAFAVTIEKAGGSATPTLETMCLLGNV